MSTPLIYDPEVVPIEETRCTTKPAAGFGVPVGAGDWRLVVEVLLPEPGAAFWDEAVWDTDTWSELEWVDMTGSVRGLDWTRGADEYHGRPRIGEALITLDNNTLEWSPWNPSPPSGSAAYFAPGTVIRAGLISSTDTRGINGWLPLFTMIVDSWNEQDSPGSTHSDVVVEITAVETMRDLSNIDENALPAVVGLDDTAGERIARLLTAANWRFGMDQDADNINNWDPVTKTWGPVTLLTGVPMQSTDMADNRLAEIYRTADSGDVVVRTSTRGQVFIYSNPYNVVNRNNNSWPLLDFSYRTNDVTWYNDLFGTSEPNTIEPTLNFNAWQDTTGGNARWVPYDADSCIALNDDEHIVNDARYARVGGTLQTQTHKASIARFGRRGQVRTDLVCKLNADASQLARNVTNRRGRATLRISNIDVSTSDRSSEAMLAVAAFDIGVRSSVSPPSFYDNDTDGYIFAELESMRHTITARHDGGVTWRTNFGFTTLNVVDLPAANLPLED